MSADGLKAGADAVKQTVTLSTGLIGLTVTFADKFGEDIDGSIVVPAALEWAWACYGVSIFFGLWCLLAISGSLDKFVDNGEELTLYRTNVRLPMYVMLVAFLVGIVAMLVAGLR